jgi:predicted DCC family thiol-disulfide oxidoreductase YuxK
MKNKILVYDDNCPLCQWYSGLFVKYGFLEPEGRKAFSVLDEKLLVQIDFNKSRNEIPLLDTTSGKVLYGIDALLEILDKKIPFIKSAGNLKPVKWFLKKLYKLVSYNRKVIVAKKCSAGSIDCAPDINYRYRFAFLAACLLVNTFMLFPIHYLIFSRLSYYHLSTSMLQTTHFSLVIANCMLAFCFTKQKAIEYLGQVNMLATTVILLLMPLLFVQLFYFEEIFASIFLIAIAIFILKEYLRRMEYAGILAKYKWIVSLNLFCLTLFLLFLFH